MRMRVRKTFLGGLVVVLPPLVTLWFLKIVLSPLDGTMQPWLLGVLQQLGAARWASAWWLDYISPLVSVTVTLGGVYALGCVARNVVGEQLVRVLDWAVMKVPLARTVYATTRQFLETFLRTNDAGFQQVVLLEYPRRGIWTLALLTSEIRGEIQARTSSDLVAVYVPTTPNPTSGYLVYAARKDLVTLDMSVDEAFKLIISGGVLVSRGPFRPHSTSRPSQMPYPPSQQDPPPAVGNGALAVNSASAQHSASANASQSPAQRQNDVLVAAESSKSHT